MLAFDDEDFDRALELVVDGPGGPQPSVAGLLVIGTERALKRSVPSASAVFQVMKGTSPKVNTDPFFLPLVDMLPRIGALMEPWNPDHEVMSGLVHVNLPDFDHQAFRETAVNAFCHRDYARMGSVRFLVDDDGLTISNPGGFIEGLSENNLLTAQPRSRNLSSPPSSRRRDMRNAPVVVSIRYMPAPWLPAGISRLFAVHGVGGGAVPASRGAG